MDTLEWLLNSDPALRWQGLRDLTDASAAEIAAERKRVVCEGIGAQILSLQQADGAWRRDSAPAWLTTLFTMQLLRAAGIDPADAAVEAAMTRLETGVRWNNLVDRWELRAAETGGNTFFEGETEPCINGGALAAGSYFRRPSDSLMRRLVAEQLEDGGWNCEAPESTRSSFHTTICVLEGLLEYERTVGAVPEVTATRKKGESICCNVRSAGGCQRGRLQIRSSSNSLFRLATTTMCCVGLTTFAALDLNRMGESRMLWASFSINGRRTDDGCSMPVTVRVLRPR